MANPIQCNKLEGEIIRGGKRGEGGEERNEASSLKKKTLVWKDYMSVYIWNSEELAMRETASE